MKDRYGREIDYLRISITDRCNLRCVYCMPEDGIHQISHKEILTYDEIKRICQCVTTLGIHKIKLTGGEPLTRKNCSELVKGHTDHQWGIIERSAERSGRGWH